jgi:hypothetical protein
MDGPRRIAISGVPQGWEQVPVKAGKGIRDTKKMSAPPIPIKGFLSGNLAANFFMRHVPQPMRATPAAVYAAAGYPVIIPSLICIGLLL